MLKKQDTTADYMNENKKNIDEIIINYFQNKQDGKSLYKVLIYHEYDNICFEEKKRNIKKLYDSGYKVIVLYCCDHLDKFEINKNCIIFRTSLDNKNQNINEYTLPYIYLDNRITQSHPIEKGILPRISFCGCKNTHIERIKGLELLMKFTDKIQCDFLIRKDFWNGKMFGIKNIEEFFNNMEKSEFVYCPRGTGTFSMRFYETLQKGRIPVITKETPLPFKKIINWTDFCVITESKENLVEDIIKFWKNNDIIDIQHKCRKLYETYFTKDNIPLYLEYEINDYFDSQVNK